LQRIALEHRPELAGLREQITKASDASRLARLALKPDYTIAAGYMLMPTGSAYRNGYMAELTMNLPTLNRARHDAETASADTATEVSRAEFDARASAIFLEVRQAQLALRSAQERARLYHDTLLPQAQAAFRSSTAAYETAHNDFATVIEVENLLLDVQTNYYQSLAAAEAAAAQLERAVGAPLPGTELERTSK
jgi:outer membrane protein TolC